MSSLRHVCILLGGLGLAGCRTGYRAFSKAPSPAAYSTPVISSAAPPLVRLPLLSGPKLATLAAVRPRARFAAPTATLSAPASRVLPRPEPVKHRFAAHSQPDRQPVRDYSPLVLAILMASLAVLLLSASVVGLTGSYIPLIGLLLLLLAGFVYFHWRNDTR